MDTDDWLPGPPQWAPTSVQIETWDWETSTGGVNRDHALTSPSHSKGRGFVPAGRGRGIAKWTPEEEKQPGVGRKPRRSSSLDRRDHRAKRDTGNNNRHKEVGADGRYENGTKDSSEYNSGDGYGQKSWESTRGPGSHPTSWHPPRKEHKQREDHRHERHRRRETDAMENGSAYDDSPGHQRDTVNGDIGRSSGGGGHRNGGDHSQIECYKCSATGHIARHCPDQLQQNQHKHLQQHHRSNNSRSNRGRVSGGESVGGRPSQPDGLRARRSVQQERLEMKHSYVPVEEDTDQLFQHGVSSGINFNTYENIAVKVTGKGHADSATRKINTFEEARLHAIVLNNLARSNYVQPTPVQKHAIPIVTAGRDLMACAQTGSGKTAAFLLPIIHSLLDKGITSSDQLNGGGNSQSSSPSASPKVIVISPTRELAIQIKDEARRFSAGSSLRACVAYGGTAIGEQASNIRAGGGCHMLIATPGRMLDFIQRGVIALADVEFLVLDEADRMLDLGFKDDIVRLVRHPDMPSKQQRHTLMFSATFPDDIQRLAGEFLHEYLFLTVGIVGGACRDVTQLFHQVSQYEKREKLEKIYMGLAQPICKSLVFVEMKKTADFIASYMCQSGFPTTSIHGDREQKEREEALDDFKCGRKPVLVATAVAARGLDIKNVELVINYDLPKSIDEYVHRIGRTGRLGNTGKAISFFDVNADSGLSADLLKVLADAQQVVPEWLVAEARRNPEGYNGTTARSFGGKDVRTQEKDQYWK